MRHGARGRPLLVGRRDIGFGKAVWRPGAVPASEASPKHVAALRVRSDLQPTVVRPTSRERMHMEPRRAEPAMLQKIAFLNIAGTFVIDFQFSRSFSGLAPPESIIASSKTAVNFAKASSDFTHTNGSPRDKGCNSILQGTLL